MASWCRWTALGGVLALAVPNAGGAVDPGKTIRGTITIAPELAATVARGDRLIIKLYHPGGGVELDAKYQIVEDFVLPLELLAVPSIDMSGRTKFAAYVVEVFIDKDDDVTSVAPGELAARTPEPVALGTQGLRLELRAASP